ncbi:dTDP-4-dehydrorhamnose reductase [Pseudodesulfovibrio sp. F-1]|uniref:dTDP-4-dehydrorhamnose reductase n=1 Tax=Pseudodesulfovibrio alkaliphilus TaxID=2661613 RepID=A0A7K1KLV0_9BACT|nr:dTDP-4-dehydrorhamnose reductase [Pseudodesulfovibrio alkaliphilus]MUM77020.1 dTDP-4-dehydrorhamnose reductase [Pseudodesulfovibrio alkaliphilus]
MQLKGKGVVIFGGRTGLLGQALTRAFRLAGARPVPLSSQDCDILDPRSVELLLDRRDPDLIVNAAAYTQVDLAEEQEEMAFALNATAPPLLASLAAKRLVPFVHFSTDFVFRGTKRTPYQPYDEPDPFSVYGISKADGERGLLRFGYERTLIIRTSWLFGPGKMNFVENILTLCETRNTLTVVNDQMGSPAYTPDVAAYTLALLARDETGIHHLANSGEATWHALATQAVTLAGLDCHVEPVPTSAYPTKAVRPAYSVLDLSRFIQATGVTPRHWQQALADYVLGDLKRGSVI